MIPISPLGKRRHQGVTRCPQCHVMAVPASTASCGLRMQGGHMLRREGHLLTRTYWRSDKAAGWAEWVEYRHPAQGEEPDSRNTGRGIYHSEDMAAQVRRLA
ncbi:unnamed protein product [Eretmochelys imbricata]